MFHTLRSWYTLHRPVITHRITRARCHGVGLARHAHAPGNGCWCGPFDSGVLPWQMPPVYTAMVHASTAIHAAQQASLLLTARLNPSLPKPYVSLRNVQLVGGGVGTGGGVGVAGGGGVGEGLLPQRDSLAALFATDAVHARRSDAYRAYSAA